MAIKFSSEAAETLDALQRASGVRPNLWARAALGYSLSKQEPIEKLATDSDGKEMQESTLLGDDEATLRALLRQRVGKPFSPEEASRLLKLHVERGLRSIRAEFERLNKRSDELMLRLLELGLESVPTGSRMATTPTPPTPKAGSFEVRLCVGLDTDTNKEVFHRLNGPAGTPHLAIMGKNGTGKTRTVLQLLQNTIAAASYDVPFLIFDFAKGDIASNEKFRGATGAEIYAPPDRLIPLAPLQLLDSSENTIKLAARRFRETISSVVKNLGAKQKELALNILTGVYHESRGQTPDLSYVAEFARETYEQNELKPDSLSACLREFADFPLFMPANEISQHPFFDKPHIVDVHKLPSDLRKLTVFLVLDHLYTQIMAMDDAPLDAKGNRQQRMVIVIDEAHHYLACKQPTLEKMVREVRSKGVAIWLLSQSPDDFDQPDYNFAKEMGLSILFSCVLGKPKMLEAILGGRVDAKEVSSLPPGVAIMRTSEAPGPVRVQAWQP